jgi:NDP-sugar pyrophosphorylase family protein
MKALILAAGQGTRLKSLTAARPKPMLPIRGKPLLQHTVEWLAGYGVRHIAVNLHHCPESILDHFGDGSRFGVALRYSYETTLLGTAGAAKRLEGYLDEPFVVVYGDVYTNLDLGRLNALHARHRREAGCVTMALYRVSNPEACGLVETGAEGRVTQFVEKPPRDRIFTDLAFSGVMICEPSVLASVPEAIPFDFGHDLLPKLLSKGAPVYAEPAAGGEFVIDIGTLDGYLAALQMAGNGEQPAALPQSSRAFMSLS